ncbi:sugar phosphate isomerase/epimerase family protein [Mesorhizobium retamae]|uniref:Sugar phosphate isomerase/epimerase n=1 Tax=Mesorhizobium retamae TaxID=2912854 RepID=A0ABS9QAV8_9HYPH|nr:sugar phosphate isomerase/epimerase [Mesorhizobium sp. IRAMC:0171]MCG7504545.1 sugar phosphate isomerase/epimerase [Mesorhizobium sp. IRAMC:0171]
MSAVTGTGISAHKRANDLSDFAEELDMIEELGVEAIELPTYDMDIVVGGKIRKPQLTALKRACAGRDVVYSVHGPLAINFMDEAYRLPRHFEVLQASLEVAAEVGAEHYVIHSGLMPMQQAAGVEAGYQRQREWLAKSGDIARQHGLILCVETLFAGYEGKGLAASPSRLATELGAINHPNVMATLDFSHAYLKLDFDGRRDEFVEEVKTLAPFSRHLHVHDSFGRQDDIWMFTDGERVAYGHGDLHLPVGWGDIPWDRLMAECEFPDGVLFNIELKERYWYAAQDTVDATKELAEKARFVRTAAAA